MYYSTCKRTHEQVAGLQYGWAPLINNSIMGYDSYNIMLSGEASEKFNLYTIA